jgi:hypothetical protein
MSGFDGGYVKVYRRLLGSPVFASEGLLKVWIWCLIKANHECVHVPIQTGRGSTIVDVLPGQFIFGRNTAAKELAMSGSTVQDRMKRLESMQNIVMQSVTHYSLVSVVNWALYQGGSVESVTQPVNHPSTNRQPSVTNKNDKNDKKKERARATFQKPTVEEVEAFCTQQGFSIDANHFVDYYESTGWKRGNTPVKNWQATVRTWVNRNKTTTTPTTRKQPVKLADTGTYWE